MPRSAGSARFSIARVLMAIVAAGSIIDNILTIFKNRLDAKTLITTTPRFGSRSIGTNLLEAAFVAVEGASGELGKERYDQLIVEAGLRPAITEL